MIFTVLRSSGLKARALRGSFWMVAGYGSSQAVRLASNLILTRLLFPEAFGLMALITAFLIGVAQLSDIAIGPSIMQNKRGDDPEFLNTAWTLQILRGVLLWICTCLIAVPVAALYEEPLIAQILPVAGISLLIAGFNPTRIETAYRHMQLGRLTVVELISQVVGLIVMISLAYALHSVWALVVGVVVSAVAKLVFAHLLMSGERNRLRFESESVRDIINFGKWIVPSSLFGYLIAQGDKLILGKYLPLEVFGIYNIAYFIGSFPILIAAGIVSRILMPVYRNARENGTPEAVHQMRIAFTAGLMLLQAVLVILGPFLIEFLYDDRYSLAGFIVVMIACSQLPLVIGLTYDMAALAHGDSRNFFFLTVARSVTQVTLLIAGVSIAGLYGALLGLMAAYAINHLFIIWLARLHNVWHPLHDAIFALLAILILALGLYVNSGAFATLAAL